jgi:rhamnulose-1-phosphate aldolase
MENWRPVGTSFRSCGRIFYGDRFAEVFRNVILDHEDTSAIIRVDQTGERYQVVWGLKNGGNPTSELPTHLMNHEVKKRKSNGKHRVIYHCHPPPGKYHRPHFRSALTDQALPGNSGKWQPSALSFSRTESGVVEWMVPGGPRNCGENLWLMEHYDVAVSGHIWHFLLWGDV